MPRTLQRQNSTSTATVVEDAKTKFLELKPAIDELKQKLKVLNKEQKGYVNAIYEHMDEEGLDELTVGVYNFKKKEVEKCSFTQKNFEALVEGDDVGEELLEKYKEKFTESKTSYNVKKSSSD